MKSKPSRKPPRSAPPNDENLQESIVESAHEAIFVENPQGLITSWNKSAERLFGYARKEAIGGPSSLLLPSECAIEETALLQRARAGEFVDHFETFRRRKDGLTLEVALTLWSVRTARGKLVGVATRARDLSDGRDSASLHLAAIVSSSDDAIISKNLDGIITSWNEGATRLFGYTAVEMVGQPVLKLLPPSRQREETEILERLRRGERVEHFETVRVRKDGTQFPVSLTISPVKNRAGKVAGASKIARDITDLKRIAREREQLLESERVARAQAEQASRMKDEFLATISHELRTPLNAIVGWAEVLKGVSDRPQEVAEGVEIIERNAFAQAKLIDDLLDLGRIAAGKMALTVDAVDIGNVVREAIAAVQHAANAKQIALKTVIHEVRGGLLGDAKRLQQVVWNLLTNAIKFTPKKGKVFITVMRTDSHIDIAVGDTGRGIDPEFLPHVFERFRQADASITREYGGLGIGLALVKQLVELHGGTVRALSPGPGQGATFTVTLPVAAAHADPLPSVPPAEYPPGIGPANLAGVKILAIDDDQDSLRILQRILTGRQAEVRTAASAAEALAVLAEYTPDVILSDIGMPVQDGYDLIRRIRQLPNCSLVPAVALTALARADDRMRALHAGFQAHVAKPVAATELAAVVRSLASLHPPARG